MGLLPANASFEELVQDYFVSVRGSGLMLSALDAELLSSWAEVGAPFEVVARGIRRAAERAARDAVPGRPALGSLRACKRDVDAELRKYLERNVGRSRGEGRPGEAEEAVASDASGEAPRARRPVEEERAARLRSGLKKLAAREPSLAAACARLIARVDEAPRTLEALAAVEERIVPALLRGLPFSGRLALLREARRTAGVSAGLSARARKLGTRVHRAAALRRALDLPPFW